MELARAAALDGQRGVLHGEPAVLRRAADRRRRDPGRPHRRLRALATKALLDGFASIALAASLGPGVAFAAITVLVVQGGISLAAGLFDNILAEGSEALAALTSAGGVLIIGIRLKLLDVKDVKVGNFLPALVIAPALVGIVSLFH